MMKGLQEIAKTIFDGIKRVDDEGNEYWYARELAGALEYASWENFEKVVTKAKVSVKESGLDVDNHFHDVMKMVSIGYGNDRGINVIKLT